MYFTNETVFLHTKRFLLIFLLLLAICHVIHIVRLKIECLYINNSYEKISFIPYRLIYFSFNISALMSILLIIIRSYYINAVVPKRKIRIVGLSVNTAQTA